MSGTYKDVTFDEMADDIAAMWSELKRRNPIGVNLYKGAFATAETHLKEISEAEKANPTCTAIFAAPYGRQRLGNTVHEKTKRRMEKYHKVLETIDKLAEAGLCQTRAEGKHEYLKDIRLACNAVHVQGGLTKVSS